VSHGASEEDQCYSWQFKPAFSPDGTQLATTAPDRTIRLWDVRTGEPIRKFAGNTAEIRGMAFTPDGRRLASTSSDGTVKLWDVATGQEVLDPPHGVRSRESVN
jgi:WD40 repeat protein